MDKITIVCDGNIKEAFDTQDGKFFSYLWSHDVECTWSYHINNENTTTFVLYGFEPVDGIIKGLIDKRTKNNAVAFLNGIGVNVEKIRHSNADSNSHEYMEKRKEFGIE